MSAFSRRRSRCRSCTTASSTRAASPTGSVCRRSRLPSASASGCSSLRARGSRTRCSRSCPTRRRSSCRRRRRARSSREPTVRVLACPASLKGALSAIDAAAALAEGLGRVERVEVEELPVADGGEGTLEVLARARAAVWHVADVHDAFGRPRQARWLELDDGRAVVEAAEAIPLDPWRLDPLVASSRGLGELLAAVGRPRELLVCLGGEAQVGGGGGV